MGRLRAIVLLLIMVLACGCKGQMCIRDRVGEVRRSLETVSSIEVLLKVANCERLPGEVQRRKIGPLGSEKVWTGSWDERKKAFVFSTNLGIPLKI